MKRLFRNFTLCLFFILLFYLPSWAQNNAPVLDSIGAQSVDEGQVLTFRVHATDADGDSLILSALDVPTNATFTDSGNGAGSFTFNPDYTQSGIYNVYFTASDTVTDADSELVHITVNNIDLPPVLDPIGWQTVTEAETLSFNVSASDPDGTIPTLYTSTLPRNASFVDSGNGIGTFTFMPDYAQQGINEVTFYASDGSLIDYEDVLIQVIDAGNQRPILQPVPPDSVVEGDTLTILVHADDPDSTIPSLSTGDLPLNAVFTDSGNGDGVLIFTPVYVQSGEDTIIFIASDGFLADTQTAIITVLEAGNQAPSLSIPLDSTAIDENTSLSFTVQGFDPDSTIPILRATNLPANATFNDSLNGRGGFSFIPDYFQSGYYVVYFQVLDSQDTLMTAVDSVQITVLNVNRVPVFERISNQSINEGDTLTVSLTATDPDGPIPMLQMSTPLANADFVDSGNGVGTLIFCSDYTQGNQNPTTHSNSFISIDSEYPSDTGFYDPPLLVLVHDVPMPPHILPVNDTSVFEGDTIIILIYVTDPDGIIPTLSAFDLPTNSSFSFMAGAFGIFRFYPSFTQVGIYTVGFSALDATSLADTELVQITVIEAGNQKPILEVIPDTIVGINDTLILMINATDPDGTIPHLTADSLPRNAVFFDSLNGRGLFFFAPDSTQANSIYEVIFLASDDSLVDTSRVNIVVVVYVRGDANGDGQVTVSDIIFVISYIFKRGPAPYPYLSADANRDKFISVSDCVYLINYIFKEGPPP